MPRLLSLDSRSETESTLPPPIAPKPPIQQFAAVAQQYGWLPQGTKARYFLGITDEELGQNASAETELKAAAGAWDRNIANLAKLALAGLYRQTSRDPQAIDLYNGLVAKPSQTVSAAVLSSIWPTSMSPKASRTRRGRSGQESRMRIRMALPALPPRKNWPPSNKSSRSDDRLAELAPRVFLLGQKRNWQSFRAFFPRPASGGLWAPARQFIPDGWRFRLARWMIWLVLRRKKTTIAELVSQYAGALYRVAYSVLRNPADAEDAVQEAFLRVLRHRATLDEVRDRRVWLFALSGTSSLTASAAPKPGRKPTT